MITDDEILSGDPALIDGERLLQVAATHTNQEIIEKVNHYQNSNVFSDRSMTVRLTRCLTRVAKSQGRPRDDLKAEFHKLREKNGVWNRKNAMMGAKSKAAKAAKKANNARLLQLAFDQQALGKAAEDDQPVDEEEHVEEEDLLGNLENGIEESESNRVFFKECKNILQDDSSLFVDDRVLKIAGVFTNAEIVEKANEGRITPFTTRFVSDRLARAIDHKAESEGRESKEVKAELEATRRANGVLHRKNACASEMRKIAMAKRKEHKTDNADYIAVTEAEIQDDEEADDEDPLADLDELSRREPDFVVERSAMATPSPRLRKTPAPFDGRPVGYMADSEDKYVAGFRVY